jgi:23S rRNA-/tRNA-specific pseudouridylate synthase
MADPAPIHVLYQDDAILAVAKQPGEPVIAARGESENACLLRRLEAQLGSRLWVVHRIDRDASGVVAFACGVEAHRALCLAFERRQVGKSYTAFTAGTPRGGGRIQVALHAARRGKTRPARTGEAGSRAAATDYVVRRCWSRGQAQVAAVEARPLTGRHHQIRVHLRWAGAPILFDPLYGRGALDLPPEVPCRRLALHARRLELPPIAGAGRLVIEAPLAPDLEALQAWLEANWRPEP